MRAMILAAGRGSRMGELTASLPKPLLSVAGHYLIEYVLFKLKAAGIHEIVINVFYHAEKIKTALGDGSQYGVAIAYSEEKERLDVGGGIVNALPLLGTQPFLVVSGDIITTYPFHQLLHEPKKSAHLVMVNNPLFHPQGDFGLHNQYIDLNADFKLTYANIGVYRPELFAAYEPTFLSWKEIMFPAIEKKLVTGEHYLGDWFNIGTPADLSEVACMKRALCVSYRSSSADGAD